MACIITGAELFDLQSYRWVHGDLHRVGDAYVFNAVLDEKGEVAWTEGEPEDSTRAAGSRLLLRTSRPVRLRSDRGLSQHRGSRVRGEIRMSRLQDALLVTGIAVMPYSGRGMMGKECLAITGGFSNCTRSLAQAVRQEISDLVQLAREAETDEDDEEVIRIQGEVEEMIEQLHQYKQDAMGYDVVLYWPDIPYDTSEDH
jgi:hypothetical protein